MTEKSVFISSCSRRELARRRPDRNLWRYEPQLLVIVLLLTAAFAFAAFVVGRGGI
jgi:hypothetical protein